MKSVINSDDELRDALSLNRKSRSQNEQKWMEYKSMVKIINTFSIIHGLLCICMLKNGDKQKTDWKNV